MTDLPVKGNLGAGRPGLGMGSSESNPEQAEARNSRALGMRLTGATYDQIGAALGIHKTTAYDAVQSALRVDRERTAAMRDEYRAIQLERLERMVMANWQRAVIGDEVEVRDFHSDNKKATKIIRHIHGPSADRVLRYLEREARLLGLDAPVKVAVTDETREAVESLVSDIESFLITAQQEAAQQEAPIE